MPVRGCHRYLRRGGEQCLPFSPDTRLVGEGDPYPQTGCGTGCTDSWMGAGHRLGAASGAGGLFQSGNAAGRTREAVRSPGGSRTFLSLSLAQSASASPPESLQDEERTGGTGLKRKREEKDLPGHYVSAPKSMAAGGGPGRWRCPGSSVPALQKKQTERGARGSPSARGLSRCLQSMVLVHEK